MSTVNRSTRLAVMLNAFPISFVPEVANEAAEMLCWKAEKQVVNEMKRATGKKERA